MADLKTFARKMREIGKRVEIGADRITIDTAKAVNAAVVIATPVDTGRARANWQAQVGSAVRSTTEETDKGGDATIQGNNSTISGSRGRGDIYISNNLDYIGALNDGSSAQAPANFVQTAAQKGAQVVRRSRLLRRR